MQVETLLSTYKWSWNCLIGWRRRLLFNYVVILKLLPVDLFSDRGFRCHWSTFVLYQNDSGFFSFGLIKTLSRFWMHCFVGLAVRTCWVLRWWMIRKSRVLSHYISLHLLVLHRNMRCLCCKVACQGWVCLRLRINTLSEVSLRIDWRDRDILCLAMCWLKVLEWWRVRLCTTF